MFRHSSLRPLSHQHQHGLALTVAIERTLQRDRDAGTTADLVARIQEAASTELLHHFDVEERVLFPAVRPYVPSAELIDELVADHGKLAGLITQLADAAPEARVTLLTQFSDLLRNHIRREERELFQAIQDSLPETELMGLGHAIESKLRALCPPSK